MSFVKNTSRIDSWCSERVGEEMNPILSLQYYIPDVEAKVFQDGRVYLYGSCDMPGNTEYCSKDYYVFSSEDFMYFQKSEIAFSNRNGEIPWSDGELYAPDCIEKSGQYYLYFCTSDGSEGVAVSENPKGPFLNPMEIAEVKCTGIDPTIFVDDDGQIYYFWGQIELKGARMRPDGKSLYPDSIQQKILTEKEHGFHEGASICKYNGRYYMLYTDISRGRATCLSYATAQYPLGPYKKGGVVIDNTGCDPKTWNNHGSLCEINNQWYVFYHRATHCSHFSRRVCVEPIAFEKDGSIREVQMTVNGQEKEIFVTRRLEASRASKLHGSVYITAQCYAGKYRECLCYIKNGDWAEYRTLIFDEEKKFFIEAGSWSYGGKIELHIESPDGPLIGSVLIESTNGWENYKTFTCDILPVKGQYILYLVFKGDTNRLFNVADFWFV